MLHPSCRQMCFIWFLCCCCRSRPGDSGGWRRRCLWKITRYRRTHHFLPPPHKLSGSGLTPCLCFHSYRFGGRRSGAGGTGQPGHLLSGQRRSEFYWKSCSDAMFSRLIYMRLPVAMVINLQWCEKISWFSVFCIFVTFKGLRTSGQWQHVIQ